MANSKPTPRKKSMDVEKPGTSAPDSSSRPIIVSGHPMVQDPMVSKEASPEPAVENESQPKTHSAKIIQPLDQQKTEENMATEQVATDTTDNPAPEQTQQDSKEQEPKESEDSTDETAKTESPKAETSEAALVDAVADQADLGSKKKDSAQTEAEKARQAELENLIAEKKYFLPIGEITRRRNNRRSILALFIVIIIAGAFVYLIADAGIVDFGFNPPFELIKN